MKKILLNFLWVLILLGSQAYAQTRTLTGVVTSKGDGLPMPGVSVKVSGTTIGTQTNANGQYTLRLPAGSKSIEFSFIGFSPLTANVGTENQINVSLSPTDRQLTEVIVTAAGLASSRKSLGTAVTTIKASQLTEAKATNIAAGLQGKVPGIQINSTSGGTNPNYRVVLRGMRSLTGNNEALIVLDNVIVPNSVLGNLNPEDVEDVQVLQGASAAALYGSDASNGALIIRTKKGKKGRMEITAQQTVTVEQTAFFPKLQKTFGSGSDNDVQVYTSYENQQYGPKFDGSVVPIGLPLANGNQETTTYSYKNDKYDFWQNGLTSQTDLSLSSGDDNGTLFMSGQYANVTGTLPKDKFNRANIRVNGTRKLSKILSTTFNINYIQNRYDQAQSGQINSIYDQLLNSPSQVPVTSYKDWKNNPYADPSGYYNAYYNNPYFSIDEYREKIKNDYLNANLDLKLSPVKWMDLTYRVGFSTRNVRSKSYNDIYRFNDYIKGRPEVGNYKKSDIVGGVTDESYYTGRITNELQAAFRKTVDDFNFNLVVAGYMRQDRASTVNATISGLVQAGLFNLNNSTNTPTAFDGEALTRQQAVYGVLNIGYKDYLFLTATGRNDWVSTLNPENRSFFYPSVNVSFVPTDAFSALKNISQIDYIKVRAGYSKVGQVNLPNNVTFGNTSIPTYGAYSLLPTFSQGSGYPYNGAGGFTLGNTLVSPNLTPEFTYTFETGTDFSLFKNRINGTVTYYNNVSKNQTVTASIANSSGFTGYRLNAGQTTGYGIESSLSVTPYKTKDWNITLGANYTYQQSKVDYLLGGIPNINLSNTTNAGSYGVAGQPFPVVLGRGYVRDSEGRIIVNRVTGYPSGTSTLMQFGNANPTKLLGVNFNASYKNFTILAVAEYRGGYQFYAGAGTGLDFSGAGINTAAYDRERFVIPNSSYLDPATNSYVANTNITVRDGGPAYWSIGGTRRNIDENYILPGNFWKIREITLAYTIPNSLLAKSKVIRSARVSVQGRNLFYFFPKTNVYTDPEYNYYNATNSGNGAGVTQLTNPPSRYFGGTLSLTF